MNVSNRCIECGGKLESCDNENSHTNLRTCISNLRDTVDYLNGEIYSSLNDEKETMRNIIYEVPDEPIALGSFFNNVKDRMDELGIYDPHVEFIVINGKICVVEPEWEDVGNE